jgi:ribokinase
VHRTEAIKLPGRSHVGVNTLDNTPSIVYTYPKYMNIYICSCTLVYIEVNMSRIAVIGSYGVGMTMVVPRLPTVGETLLGGNFALGPGGKGSNQAICAQRLGAEVEFLTCIGPDNFGRDAHELWAREGVSAKHVKTGTRSTMVGFILVEPGGENRIVVAPGALDELGSLEVETFAPIIESADLCLVSLEIPVETAVTALRVARRVGTPTLLNPAPAAPLPDEAWSFIDYLTPNSSEAQILTNTVNAMPPATPDELVSLLRAYFNGVVILTLGKDGALVDDKQSRMYVPAIPPRQIVDTTGAGDAFAAALAVAITEGQPLLEAAHFAAAAGAHAVSIAQVIPSLPYRRDLDMLLDRR